MSEATTSAPDPTIAIPRRTVPRIIAHRYRARPVEAERAVDPESRRAEPFGVRDRRRDASESSTYLVEAGARLGGDRLDVGLR